MFEVIDHPSRRRFELEADGHTAFTVYTRHGGVITFIRTEIPTALSGRGIGARLTRGAFSAGGGPVPPIHANLLPAHCN